LGKQKGGLYDIRRTVVLLVAFRCREVRFPLVAVSLDLPHREKSNHVELIGFPRWRLGPPRRGFACLAHDNQAGRKAREMLPPGGVSRAITLDKRRESDV
jgi:hypothetical protein